jgi:hypothetical protein
MLFGGVDHAGLLRLLVAEKQTEGRASCSKNPARKIGLAKRNPPPKTTLPVCRCDFGGTADQADSW